MIISIDAPVHTGYKPAMNGNFKPKDRRQAVSYRVDESQWHRHPNGGGWVMNTAHVDDTAFVGPEAVVAGFAQVLGNAKIGGHAVVLQEALVKDHAVVAGRARVAGRAVISQRAKALGDAQVSGDAMVFTDSIICGVLRSKTAKVFSGFRISNGGTKDYEKVYRQNRLRRKGINLRPVAAKNVSHFAEQPISDMTSGLSKYQL